MAQEDEGRVRPSPLRRLIPGGVKQALKRAWLEYKFSGAVRRIADLPPGSMPTRDMLERLQAAWTNRGFVAKGDYLEEVARRAVETDGPILECGSGLTTILVGLLAGRRGVVTWSLEHMPVWHARVRERVKRYGIRGVHVCLSPLREYGGFSWYDPPAEMLPGEFKLVICDGPPESTPGGRYGLLPVLGDRLQAGALILLDDANRPSETEVLRRWGAEADISVEMRERPTGTFALVTRR
ncbi:MAG TPA: hypothetical protein VEX60_14955 [Pyrinomonadaceae bacterium]|nr:hypothetical protein [Pyrinomonadaceae bacterium]